MVTDRTGRRRTGVIRTRRQTSMAYVPELVNDGGTDAPLSRRDDWLLAACVGGVILLGLVIALVWSLVA
jgi:hypothetical protein